MYKRQAVGTPDVVFLKLRGRNLVAADTCVPEGGLGAYLCGVCCGDALLARLDCLLVAQLLFPGGSFSLEF